MRTRDRRRVGADSPAAPSPYLGCELKASDHDEIFAPGLMDAVVCVVTGGGTGIGFATARHLYALGASVALFGRRRDVVADAARQLDPNGERIIASPCDIREPEDVERAVGQALDRFGAIHVLVNNAGGQYFAQAEAISPVGFEAVVRTNLLGTWNMTREVAVRSMIPQGGGAIVNVIAQVERGFPGLCHSGAARAGVENMTRTLAVEWAEHRIRVNAVAPGFIHTEGIERYPGGLLEQARRLTPMKRLGTREEIALSIVFLASRASSFVTGETLVIDGGARLWSWGEPAS